MSDGFNPYREWLGLGTNAPNYYELLGLPLQESDTAKIAAAADWAIARVRSFRPGPQAREWACLLDEIRAAKQCLLDVDCRTRYVAEQTRAAGADPILPPELPPENEISAPPSARAVNSSSDLCSPTPGRPATVETPQLPEAEVVPVAAQVAAPSWQAGPSPIYGITGNSAPASTSLPAATVAPSPLSPMPAPRVNAEQLVIQATYGSPQRATFRAATPQPQKTPRSRGRGVVWAAIFLLWLVVAGLTYRLSNVARQQKLADEAAAEAEAKDASKEPQRNPSPHAQSEGQTPAITKE